MVRHPRGGYIVTPLLSLEVATPKNKINPFDAVIHMQENPPHKRFLVGCSSSLFMRLSPNTSRRFKFGASNACLVGENPTRSVPAL